MNIIQLGKCAIYHTGRYVMKNLPKILTITGGTAMVAGTAIACKRTYSLDEDIKAEITQVKTEAPDSKKALLKRYIKLFAKLTKVYAAPVALQIVGIIMVAMGHGLLANRLLEAIASLGLVQGEFAQYRQQVIDDQGAEKDLEYMYGMESTKIARLDESGNEIEEDIMTLTPYEREKIKGHNTMFFKYSPATSLYCREEDPLYYRLFYLKGKRDLIQQKLNAHGFICENEILDICGLKKKNDFVSQINGITKETDEPKTVKMTVFGDDIEHFLKTAEREFVYGFDRMSIIPVEIELDGICCGHTAKMPPFTVRA